jgi:hypothetical protein
LPVAVRRPRLLAPCSWRPEKSEIESSEHQENADIHCQPFPESVFEEHDIYTDYDGCHRYRIKHSSDLSAHFSHHTPDELVLERIIAFTVKMGRQVIRLLPHPLCGQGRPG